MKYSSFEELAVWKASIKFAVNIFTFTEQSDFKGLGDTKNQLERASLSISNNIAEGFERGTTAELINFLYIARGSAGESRSMLRLCEGLDRFSNSKSQISNLIGQAVNISTQLHGWLESLKNSDIKGVKFLTQQERSRYQQKQGLDDFDKEMAEFKRNHKDWLVRRQSDPTAKL
jgi:four helix bundle protein